MIYTNANGDSFTAIQYDSKFDGDSHFMGLLVCWLGGFRKDAVAYSGKLSYHHLNKEKFKTKLTVTNLIGTNLPCITIKDGYKSIVIRKVNDGDWIVIDKDGNISIWPVLEFRNNFKLKDDDISRANQRPASSVLL